MRLLACLALLAGALAAGACGLLPERARPNLLVVSIDTLRQDRVGAYGYARPTTPTVDALAARGVVFEDATAPSPWTVPSHASLLTGLLPQSHGATGRRTPIAAGAETLAGWLGRHGWDTAAVVNILLLGPERGFARGFDHFEFVKPKRKGPAAPEIHARALRWLDEPRERPFFLFLHHYDVHSDYAPAAPYRELLVGPYEGPADGSSLQLKDARLGRLSFSADDVRHLSELYDAGIRQLDDELGRFLDALDRRGLLANTLVIVTSDHGEEFLEHGGVLHGRTLYEELVRVPLVVAGPGVPPGRRVAGPVSLIDVFPTATALLGAPPPPYVEGVDLWAGGALRAPADRALFFATDWWLGQPRGARRRALRLGAWKLHAVEPGGALELYDLAADPGERRDLAAGAPERVAALRDRLAPHLGPPPRAHGAVRVTAEEAAELRALGYLE